MKLYSRPRSAWFIPAILCLGFSLLLFASCGSDDDDPTGVAGNAPTITITSPLPGSVDTGPTWTITGTSTSTDGVSITFLTSSGHSGSVTGSLSSWTAQVDMGHGDVGVTFTITDGDNRQETAQLNLISNHYMAFSQDEQLLPSGTILLNNTIISAYATLAPSSVGSDSERSLQTVELVLLGSDPEIIIGTLTDDGDLFNGDEINGDNIYSMVTNYSFEEIGHKELRIRATYILADATTVQDFGKVQTFDVIEGVELQDMQNTIDHGQSGWTTADGLITDGASIASAAAQTVTMLQNLDGIASAETTDDGFVVWYETTAGLRGNILLNPDGTRGGGGSGKSDRGGPVITAPYAWEQSYAKEEDIGSNNVLIFDAFNWQFSPFDEGPFLNGLFNASLCPTFEVDYFIDTNCTVDVVSTFNQYGTIIIVTHGGREDGEVFFMTGQVATATAMEDYEFDLLLEDLVVTTVGGVQYFSIMPGFISSLGTFPESVVYNGSCESQANSTMSDAFLDNGTTAYLGFTRVVNSDFAQTVSVNFFTEMVTNGDNSNEAFTAGLVDPGSPFATFTISSNDEAAYNDELTNTSFEDGDLTGWTKAGDGRVITALGSTMPTDGLFMGIISTGLGYTVNSGSITASVCDIAEDEPSMTLTFDWNFFSEEFLEFCGSAYQDFFEVVIIIDGSETTLLYEWVDSLCGSVSASDIFFDQGDVYNTGWQSASFDLPALIAGQSLQISFRAGDIGDSIYDTAILIDNVVLE